MGKGGKGGGEVAQATAPSPVAPSSPTAKGEGNQDQAVKERKKNSFGADKTLLSRGGLLSASDAAKGKETLG
ncbi:MAG: hypothetical protein PHI35_03275 [Victivallaceae bacterium]|nr:hypothetical protein [Victivallaceae bacterium]